jgi:hypothetical protein
MSSNLLKPGARLRSQVCGTEVIVVRPGTGQAIPKCGGYPMVDFQEEPVANLTPKRDWSSGTVLGKRYTSPDDAGLELLVTKAGAGTLGSGNTALIIKETKPLPSSD